MPEPHVLTCACCGERYERGHWTCCAPPSGMKSQYWLELCHYRFDDGGCGKCPWHCQCDPLPEPIRRFRQGTDEDSLSAWAIQYQAEVERIRTEQYGKETDHESER